jgi:hypothetical protein
LGLTVFERPHTSEPTSDTHSGRTLR